MPKSTEKKTPEKMWSCTICEMKDMNEISYISHLLGKKHKHKADMRVNNGDSLKNHRRCIKGLTNFLPVNEELTKELLDHDIVDVRVHQGRVFVEFTSKEAADNFSRNGFTFKGVLLSVVPDMRVQRRKTKKPSSEVMRVSPTVTEELEECTSCPKKLDQFVRQIVFDLELKPADNKLRNDARFFLESFLNQTFRNVKVHIFGSSANNLGFKGCDLDLVAEFGAEVWREKDGCRKADDLTRFLAKIIRLHGRGTDVVAICQARVPIIKYTDSMTKLDVDLSFRNKMPIYNTELIRFYTTIHPLVRPYMMVLRYWAKIQNVSGGGKPNLLLTNYCFCLMMLFQLMLRNNPVVPCVGELQENLSQTPWRNVVINGWKCGFSDKVDKWRQAHHTVTLFDLIMEFFEFFGQLDANEWAISPVAGVLIKKRSLIKRHEINQPDPPRYLEVFFNRHIPLPAKTPLCVQDPFELKHNVASNLKDHALKQFQYKCRKALSICKDIKEGKVPFRNLFIQIKKINFDTEGENMVLNEASVIDEVVSVGSNESIELLQEIESLERNGGLLETSTTKEEATNADSMEKTNDTKGKACSSLLELSEKERADIRAALYGAVTKPSTSSSSTHEIVELNGASSEGDVTVLQEIQGEKKPAAGSEVIELDNASNPEAGSSAEDVQEIAPSKASKKKAKKSRPPAKETDISSLLPQMNVSIFRFYFDFDVRQTFELSPEGNLKLDEGENSDTNVCLETLAVKFWEFILKSVLYCEVEKECDQQTPDTQAKRKNEEVIEQLPAKYFKGEDDTKSGHYPLGTYKNKTLYNIWEGRTKLKQLKSMVGNSALSPLQSEVVLTKEMIRNKQGLSFTFETTISKESKKPTSFFVDSKFHSLDPKARNKYYNFYSFYAKITQNLAAKTIEIINQLRKADKTETPLGPA